MRALGLAAAIAAAALLMAAPASARDLRCNGVVKGKVYDDVVVPPRGACTLTGVLVRGDITAKRDAYLQATRTRVRGDVEGKNAQTVFVDKGSKVSGGMPPPSNGEGAKRVQSTMPSCAGSPEATPNENGSVENAA